MSEYQSLSQLQIEIGDMIECDFIMREGKLDKDADIEKGHVQQERRRLTRLDPFLPCHKPIHCPNQ